ncbi:UNVERIFIED_CONTAM: hypothetical protein HDU68_012721 [Siphonaria sp. JEL0065]|nr:hypothetical protein HDU68_012721 [Siphonaria sp. JEL0065]
MSNITSSTAGSSLQALFVKSDASGSDLGKGKRSVLPWSNASTSTSSASSPSSTASHPRFADMIKAMSLKRSRPAATHSFATAVDSSPSNEQQPQRSLSLPVPAKASIELEPASSPSIDSSFFTRSPSTSPSRSQKTVLGAVHKMTSVPLLSTRKPTTTPSLPQKQQQQKSLSSTTFSWLSLDKVQDPDLAITPRRIPLNEPTDENNMMINRKSWSSRTLRRTRSFYHRASPEEEDSDDDATLFEEEEPKDIAMGLFDAVADERPSFADIMEMEKPFQFFVASKVEQQHQQSIKFKEGGERRRKVPPRIERTFSLPLVNELEMWLVDQIYTVSYQKLNQGSRPLADEVVMSNLIKSLSLRFPALQGRM